MLLKIHNFRTQFWYANIVEIITYDGLVEGIEGFDSGKTPPLVEISPKWFALRFPRPRTTPESDRKNWSRYRSGETVPRKRLGFHPVKAVAKVYPSTGRYFFTMLWDILSGDKLDKNAIEKTLSLLGPRVKGERHGLVGKILLDQKFWKQGVNIKTVQAARYSILKDAEPFELIEALVLMLAWADADSNSNLWNEICEFYYYVIPEIVWADNIRLRFELLDIVDKYAQKRQKIPYRRAIELEELWRNQTNILQTKLATQYAALMHTHLYFWQKKELDEARLWWAQIVAIVVMNNFNLWDRYSDLSWLAADVFFRMVSGGKIEFYKRKKIKLFGFPRKGTSRSNKLILKQQTKTEVLEEILRKEIKVFVKNPNSYEFEFKQILSG